MSAKDIYHAVPLSVFSCTLQEAIARPVLADLAVALVAFDPQREVICQWTT
jgi:hypothetical protein